jgi:Icc protein
MFQMLQLTDLHLMKNAEDTLYDICAEKNLDKLLKHLKRVISEVEAFFLTGDLSQDETPESYHHIAQKISQFKKPVYWFNGNHDDLNIMTEVFSGYSLFHFLEKVRLHNWEFIRVDTVKPSSASGFLSAPIQVPSADFYALLMHHHPCQTGTPLIDKYILENPEKLGDFIEAQEVQPKVMITGHVHEGYELEFNNIPVVTSPATCFQFVKKSITLTTANTAGATLWTFHSDGKFEHKYLYA